MNDLTKYAGRRVEVEVNGQRLRGRVVRGPGRQAILLEERGLVGEDRSDAHTRLGVLRTWTGHQLLQAKVLRVLPQEQKKRRPPARRTRPWSDVVALAESDPTQPPPDWQEGLLAWAQKVQAARRQVDRSRKAMLEALREASS